MYVKSMEYSIGKNKIQINEKLIKENRETVRKQLEEYMNGGRKEFSLSIEFPSGFTGKVMKEMSRIPYGETRSYGEIAQKLETAPIAVGQACGKNPVPVIVPCHRIVGKSSIGGYHYGLELKQKLLDLESGN